MKERKVKEREPIDKEKDGKNESYIGGGPVSIGYQDHISQYNVELSVKINVPLKYIFSIAETVLIFCKVYLIKRNHAGRRPHQIYCPGVKKKKSYSLRDSARAQTALINRPSLLTKFEGVSKSFRTESITK
jgi:hypothetical protein